MFYRPYLFSVAVREPVLCADRMRAEPPPPEPIITSSLSENIEESQATGGLVV